MARAQSLNPPVTTGLRTSDVTSNAHVSIKLGGLGGWVGHLLPSREDANGVVCHNWNPVWTTAPMVHSALLCRRAHTCRWVDRCASLLAVEGRVGGRVPCPHIVCAHQVERLVVFRRPYTAGKRARRALRRCVRSACDDTHVCICIWCWWHYVSHRSTMINTMCQKPNRRYSIGSEGGRKGDEGAGEGKDENMNATEEEREEKG